MYDEYDYIINGALLVKTYEVNIFGATRASKNVTVATSRAALLDRPPPIGTFVIMTALKLGISLP